jgi:allantoate deiminase
MDRRLTDRLDALYAIGAHAAGADRLAYTANEDAAHALVSTWMADVGLEVARDPVGNLFGRLRGTRPELAEVWTGSHLDSVPGGGRFDGPLGVVAGLEAVERIGRQERTLCVVAFRDEEGSRFGRGCFGSRALCGLLEPGELDTRDAAGIALREAVGNEPSPGGWLDPPLAFVEVHIEQGPELERRSAPLGVVTAIVGLARLAVIFDGREGHAGTTPMSARDDALCKAASFVLAVRDTAERVGHGAVATVGSVVVTPNAANVIPAVVELLVDARAPEETTLAELLREIQVAAAGARLTQLRRTSPAPMDVGVRDVIGSAIVEVGVDVQELYSGAGHDAGVLARAGVPSGMLFVRSRNGGISHSPDEHSDDADVRRAVEALMGALRRLASSA